MPRGPGKKSNYNLDYSRFNQFDHAEEEVKAEASKPAGDGDAAGGGPSFDEMLKNMPPELQEAFRLTQISKATGDLKAQKRANELAIRAVQNGDPNVRRQFVEHLGQQMPDVADKFVMEMNKGTDPAKLLESLEEEPPPSLRPQEPDIGDTIGGLRDQMKKGAESTRRQLEELEKQQKDIERLKSPEDLIKFMNSGGMSQEDMQRIMGGDMGHMEATVGRMIDSAAETKPGENPEKAIEAAEGLHAALFGEPAPAAKEEALKEEPKPAPRPKPPPEPEVTIPMHRLQYKKDDDGRYQSVELKCSLEQVADMSAVLLDVSERHIRLNTIAPAPLYAVNAGPFPILLDPSAARAKFSKKKQELTVTVPAKPN